MEYTDRQTDSPQRSNELLHHLGELAKLDIPPEEEAQLECDMKEILHFVDKMKEFQLPGEEVWREDVVTNGAAWESMTGNAPLVREQGFVTPGVLESDGDSKG